MLALVAMVSTTRHLQVPGRTSPSRRERPSRSGTWGALAGWLLVLAGLVLMCIPGPPGTLVVLAGLSALAPHAAWANRLLGRLRRLVVGPPREPRGVRSALCSTKLGAVVGHAPKWSMDA